MGIVVNNVDQEPFLYLPGRPSAGRWVRFKLVGTRSNRDAIGSRITISAAGLTQTDEVRSADSYVSSSDVRVHFGVGDAPVIEQVQIRWPDGSVEQRTGLQINREHVIRQSED
ncbi:MAG: hypothetical protein DMG05_18215 [Acidobacteria bacterium]|nr:MAG: hypothetical protein DMG05_18215 [Acidobacteriota bacterium]